MKKTVLMFLPVVAGISVASPAIAEIIADTGFASGLGTQWVLNSNQSLFGLFSTTVNTITGIEGGIYNGSGATQTFTATLYNDQNGSLGGIVGSTTFDVPSLRDIPDQVPFYGRTDLNLKVNVGQSYWVGFSSLSPLSQSMPSGAPNPLSGYGASNDGSNFQFFRADYLAFGVRISGENAIAAVPEPATWAMMIGGLGAVGGVMRRRRAANVRVAYA